MKLEQLIPHSARARLARSQLPSPSLTMGNLIGKFQSLAKGTGLTFSELREYAPGDEVRRIDWKSTARGSRVYVRSYEEERQLRVWIALDTSSSMRSALSPLPGILSSELAALIAYLTKQASDECGLCTFNSTIQNLVPAASSPAVWDRIATLLNASFPENDANFSTPTAITGIAETLTELRNRLSTRSCLFIISDFYTNSFAAELRSVTKGTLTVLAHISPDVEEWLPEAGLLNFNDSEFGGSGILDSSNAKVRLHLQQKQDEHAQHIQQIASSCRALYFRVRKDPDKTLRDFLNKRKKI